jgi:hypothetical protein
MALPLQGLAYNSPGGHGSHAIPDFMKDYIFGLGTCGSYWILSGKKYFKSWESAMIELRKNKKKNNFFIICIRLRFGLLKDK